MRFIFLGDVHGCIVEFQELIERLALRPDDQVFCAGDFMDRGPDPVACVRFARERGFQSIMGNHEEKHVRWRKHEDRAAKDPTYTNPMLPMTLPRLAQNAALTAEDVAWLQGLPLVLEPFPGLVLVHGGLFPGQPLAEQMKDKKLRDKILRLRWVDADGEFVALESDTDPNGPPGSRPWMEVYDGPSNVVYGHAVHSLSTPRVDIRPNGVKTYGIDTGCCFGGRLTALVVEGGSIEFVQVDAKRAYAAMRSS